MKIDQFNAGKWQTRFHDDAFVTRFIYQSNDFLDGTTMIKDNDQLIFELSGKQRSLYLHNISDSKADRNVSINQIVLYSLGLCPDKSRGIDELVYGVMGYWGLDDPDLESIYYLEPLHKQIESRQSIILDELGFDQNDLTISPEEIDSFLNAEIHKSDDLLSILIVHSNSFEIFKLPTKTKKQQETDKKISIFNAWMEEKGYSIKNPIPETKFIVWQELRNKRPELFSNYTDPNHSTIKRFFTKAGAKFR